jgi:hypothetical protein
VTGELDAVTLAQAEERLRQERELFDRRMLQDEKTFRLRLAVGWTTIVLFVAICAFCGYVIINSGDFSAGTVTAATSALLVEALGLVGAMLKGTIGTAPKDLEPITDRPALPPGG